MPRREGRRRQAEGERSSKLGTDGTKNRSGSAQRAEGERSSKLRTEGTKDGAGSAQRAEGERSSGPGAVGHAAWSGSISFGLVTVPIELYSAQRPAGLPLRMLAPDGTPLQREYVCPREDRPLEREELARGYAVGEEEFVLVSDEELAALAPRRSRDIELTRFVKRDAIDPSYFVRSYFMLPAGEQTKAYALLAETMEQSGRAALASFVMRDKSHAVAIFADDGILRAEVLRHADELRSAATVGLARPRAPEEAQVRKLRKAIEAQAADALDPDELRDDEPERLLALAQRKRERGVDVVEAPEPAAPEESEGETGELVDLVALLKQRLRKGERAGPKRATARPKGGAQSATTRRSARAESGRRAASKPAHGSDRSRRRGTSRTLS